MYGKPADFIRQVDSDHLTLGVEFGGILIKADALTLQVGDGAIQIIGTQDRRSS